MEITPQDLKTRIDQGEKLLLIDIREPQELEICSIAGARHIPMRELPASLETLPSETPLILYCHHGMRSMRAAMFLRQQGFEKAFSLQGGIEAWADEIDPEMKRY